MKCQAETAVDQINGSESGLQNLSDEDLRRKSADRKARLSPIHDNKELAAALNGMSPEAFAVVRNACRRMFERKAEVTVRGIQ